MNKYDELRKFYNEQTHDTYLLGCTAYYYPTRLFFWYPQDESVFDEFDEIVVFNSIGKPLRYFTEVVEHGTGIFSGYDGHFRRTSS